jgi:hypothetical protein
MNIRYDIHEIKPVVLSEHNGRQNVLKEVMFTVIATDEDSGLSSGIVRTWHLDIDREYTDEDPFVPFSSFTESMIDTMLRDSLIKNGWSRLLEKRIQDMINSTTPTTFAFQNQ